MDVEQSGWKVWAWWVLVPFCLTNILVANEHYRELSKQAHHWECRRTGASFWVFPDTLPNHGFYSGFSGGPYDWKLTQPTFSPWLPWNWLSAVIVFPTYDPEEVLRTPTHAKPIQ